MPAKEPSENYIGKKFGRLTILEDLGLHPIRRKRMVLAVCECGIIRDYMLTSIKKGDSKSCGCIVGDLWYDVVGKEYGMLTVIEELMRVNRKRVLLVQCECGNRTTADLNNLKSGNTTSCGCYAKKLLGERNKTHGLCYHLLYGTWGNIKTRCYNKNSENFPDYGLRGISMCDEWHYSFLVFYNWCIKNGWEEGLTVERKDNDGNYEPSNCIIATTDIQARNKRNNIYIEFDGRKMVVADWSKELGIPFTTITQRLKMGLPIEQVLSSERLKWGTSNVPKSEYSKKAAS